MLNKYSHLLPDFPSANEDLFNVECDTLKQMIGMHCFYPNPEEYLEFVKLRLLTLSTDAFPLSISSEEKELLIDLLYSMKENPFMDFAPFIERWENLEIVNESGNKSSLAMIAITSSLQKYLSTHDVFPEEDTPQALWYKAASIIGGFAGTMLVDGMWDIISDGDLTADEMLENAIKGAVVGAMF
jgi:hypothetical protein